MALSRGFTQLRSSLTIFADSGDVLWSGELKPRRKCLGWLYPKQAVGWFAQGTDWKTWHGYFCHQPPLKAQLQRY